MTYNKADIMRQAWTAARRYMANYGMTQREALAVGLRDAWGQAKWRLQVAKAEDKERAYLAALSDEKLERIMNNYGYDPEGEKYRAEWIRRAA